jgi:hypothetical protein
MSGLTLHGKVPGQMSSQQIEIGSHGDPFPEPKDYLDGSDTTYTGDIKYLYGHGTGGALCNINYKSTEIGLRTTVRIIGLYPTNASSVTWTGDGDITVY